MKRMWFVSVGALPVRTINDEWVDLKYLEKGMCTAGGSVYQLDIRQVKSFLSSSTPTPRPVSCLHCGLYDCQNAPPHSPTL